ncbi:MAG: VWA-like domain-containing protein [Clostridia bacterium]|nr:VWA-like domain-containing protein [Clostridia bacterium]
MDIRDVIGMTLVKLPKFRTFLHNRKIISDPSCKTAYTDGKMIGYNSHFLEGLSESERVFVLAHEILHILFRHANRAKGRDRRAWNFVTDAIDNQHLTKAGLTPPEGAIIAEGADKYDAEELYDLLITDSPKLSQEIRDLYKKMTEEQVKHLEDTHGRWGYDKDIDFPNDGEESVNIDERTFTKENEEMKRQMREKFNQDNARELFSGTGAGIMRDVNEIGKPTQLVNWKTMVRSCIRKRKKEPDGSYEVKDGILSKRTRRKKEKTPTNSEIILDTSGSVDEEMLRGFLKECKSILKDSKLKVGCFDTKFYGFQSVNDVEDLENIILQGGGCTDLVLAASSFSKEVKNKIIFTDGYGDEPKEAEGVIWIVYGNKDFNVPAGSKAVFVDPYEIDEMRASGVVRDSFVR